MSRRRGRKPPAQPIELRIDDLSHDGRGVATHAEKRVFVRGALPGERVVARLTAGKRRYDEAEVTEVIEASPDRVAPRCPHFGVCGACSLQHLRPARQIEYKQNTLLQNLNRIGRVEPESVYPPLVGSSWGYRRRARLSVRYVPAKGRVLVGFRETYGRFVADMQECHVLDARVAAKLPEICSLIYGLQARQSIPQIEVACGDTICALVVRHLEPLVAEDLSTLREFARRSGLAILLQPAGPDSIEALEPAEVELSYGLPEYGLELAFGASDFIQINAEMNRRMIARSLELLAPAADHRILDLFCGLGNFSLPIATCAAEVVAVEGDAGLIRRASVNAARNEVCNVHFHVADLAIEPGPAPWLHGSFDSVLIDPPRSGAESVLAAVAATGTRRIVYVSCHPASLARDAGVLAERFGFRLRGAGVMDMFPHTGHVESIALFERSR